MLTQAKIDALRVAFEKREAAAPKFTEVQRGPEMMRILRAPRRPVPDPGSAESIELAAFLTKTLSKSSTLYPGPLLPVQALALQEAWSQRGLFAPMRAGSGKTLLSYLLPVVMQAKRPLYVCPAAMKPDVAHEFFQYFRCWRGPSMAQYPIKSYELLSSVSSAEDRDASGAIVKHALLERLKPDLIVFDEGHKLADSGSAGTKRVRAYLKANPSTMVCWMTGTPFKSSIKDAAHVLKWVLGDASPLPDDFLERESWASYLDASTGMGPRAGAGALLDLLTPEETREFDLAEDDQALRIVRRSVARRLLETPGVLGTQDAPLSIELNVRARYPESPDRVVEAAYAEIRETWCLPDGTELSDGLEVARHLNTLGLGLWNRWEPAPPDAWRESRNEWARYCRRALKHNRMNLDSEARVADAVRKGLLSDDGLLDAWEAQRDLERKRTGLREPPSVPVWISDEAIRSANAWLNEGIGVIWVDLIGLGLRLAEDLEIPYYGAKGLDAKGRHIKRHPGGPAIASLAANGTGRNLQHFWHRNLWLCVPGEQSVARTHRAGQLSDSVDNDVYLGCAEHLKRFERASEVKAEFAQDMLLSPQRLVYANTDMPTARELAMRGGARWFRRID